MKNLGKDDTGKIMWDRLPFESLDEIAKVMTFGALKYNEDREDPNWKKVPNPLPRYFAAMMRHISLWKQGEKIDPESGLSHLAHAGFNLLALISFEKNENKMVRLDDVHPSISNDYSNDELLQPRNEEKEGIKESGEVDSETQLKRFLETYIGHLISKGHNPYPRGYTPIRGL